MEFTNGTCMLGPLKRGGHFSHQCVRKHTESLSAASLHPHTSQLARSRFSSPFHNTESLEPAGILSVQVWSTFFANLWINFTGVGHSAERFSWVGGERGILWLRGSVMLHLKGVC